MIKEGWKVLQGSRYCTALEFLLYRSGKNSCYLARTLGLGVSDNAVSEISVDRCVTISDSL